MGKLRGFSIGISIDGFAAGPDQDLDNPYGVGGRDVHKWHIATRTHQNRLGGPLEGTTGVDDDFDARSYQNIGAWIIGRNMFGPIRGAWPNQDWKGWWGSNPPFHVPVFVLTHYDRPSIEMEGDTTFHFVTDGIDSALKQAKEAAREKDIRLGGGVATIREYLKAGLVDEMHIAVTPVLLGIGEHLLRDIDLTKSGYQCVEFVPSPNAAHVVIRK